MNGAVRSIIAAIVLLSVLAPGVLVEQDARQSPKGALKSTLKKPRLRDRMLSRFIVVPEHKLLFCYMEKVGCMNFNELFRQVRSKYDPSQLHGAPWDIWFRNSPANHSLTKADLEDILVDKSWHKAVFWRLPVERFASAYASKCAHADADGAEHCKAQFGVRTLPFLSATTYIAHKDDMAAEAGHPQSDDRDDEHFMRMRNFCGGLDLSLEYYDTVKELTVDTSHHHVSELLRTVGIDPKTIETFDFLFPPPEKNLMAWTPKGLQAQELRHNTGTLSQMSALYPPTQPWVLYSVAHHYSSDYELFKMNKTALLRQDGLLGEPRWPLLDTVWNTGDTKPLVLGSPR